MNDPELIPQMLGLEPRTIAVIGLSDRPDRPSHYVSAYMQQQGYTIYPINPSLDRVLGQKAYPSLAALPIRPTIVNVFRTVSFLPAIVEEMLTLNLSNLWIQQGIIHREAAAAAEAGGIRVIMDLCIMVEHRNLAPRLKQA